MSAIGTWATGSALCLLAAVNADAAAPIRQGFDVHVFVVDCYASSAVNVAIDGRPLELMPPARRDDSVAICYDRLMRLGSRTSVHLRSGNRNRTIAVSVNRRTHSLVISPAHAPYAQASVRDAPLAD